MNQVQDVYNGLGQLITEYQNPNGAVNTSTTLKVQYGYSDLAHGSRIISMTYPNGRVLNYNYGGTGFQPVVSQLTSISDSSGTLESYTYLGESTVIGRAHPEYGVNLTITLDDFGRMN